MEQFVEEYIPDKKLKILNLGGRVVKGQGKIGSHRQFLTNKKRQYTGADTEAGTNVDVGKRISMNTLDFIIKRYGIDPKDPVFPTKIRHSRWKEMPILFRDLGFKKGAEIGVYSGRFSVALCAGNPDLELIGVDPWESYENYIDYDAKGLKEAHKNAVARTAKFNVKFMKMTSVEAAKKIKDGSLDFVFIDANHDYEHVVEDIAAWSKKVRKGGLVCGHDYIKLKNGRYDNFGVIEAVNGWCGAYNIKPLFIWKDQCPSWMYVK